MKIAILHHNDADGFGAAYACWTALRGEHDLKFIPVQYSQDPPLAELREFGAEKIYIVDFSYKREVILSLREEFGFVFIADHHKTAEAEILAVGGAVFDLNTSGAVLTWNWFFPEDTEPPKILQYVQDRDLWKFELPNSKEVNAYIATLPWDFQVWDTFKLEDALLVGGALVKQQKRQIDARLKDARMTYLRVRFETEDAFLPFRFEDYYVPIVNATENISELGEAMCFAYPDAPFSISYADRADGKRSYSLRSRNGFDVSVVAKALGGGGHKAAAGFTLDAPEAL